MAIHSSSMHETVI